MTWVLLSASVVGLALGTVRWLRVAQREHYLPEVGRFAYRWWTLGAVNRALGVVMVAGAFGTLRSPWMVLPVAIMVGGGPVGLSLRGRTAPLAWTSRLKRTAVATGLVVALPLAIDRMAGTWVITAFVLVCLPLLIDGVLALLRRFEDRLGEKWIRQAAEGLERSKARVVAITGSYGKTTTKGLIAHLLAGIAPVIPSPASFNNRMGLARAINEHLTPGTDVFVAEMGTYGRGEIAALCEWIPPDVAVITAIGPVHLERMRTEEAILEAKREILVDAPVAVISIDHPLLAALAAEEAERRVVIRCSSVESDVDVFVDPATGVVAFEGEAVAAFDPGTAHAGNVACAVGAVVGLGFDVNRVIARLRDLPPAPHRRTVGSSDRGFTIIDDTFNSNPAGARAALDTLEQVAGSGKMALVTPGMVELGGRQYGENRSFAADAAQRGVDWLVVVGHTNRLALLDGAQEHGLGTVIVVDTREEAVAWVRGNLRPGDAVLYENDLPDHYP